MAEHTLVGQGLLITEASRLHSDTLHWVGLLWTSDRAESETSTRQHTTLTRKSSMQPSGFELTVPASDRTQTHGLDRAAKVSLREVKFGV